VLLLGVVALCCCLVLLLDMFTLCCCLVLLLGGVLVGVGWYWLVALLGGLGLSVIMCKNKTECNEKIYCTVYTVQKN